VSDLTLAFNALMARRLAPRGKVAARSSESSESSEASEPLGPLHQVQAMIAAGPDPAFLDSFKKLFKKPA
jgi:hypothetical protein